MEKLCLTQQTTSWLQDVIHSSLMFANERVIDFITVYNSVRLL